MKKTVFLLIMTVALLFAWSVYADEDAGEKQPLTLEYVLTHTDLTAEMFEGIDFEAFAEYYELTIKDVHWFGLKYLPDAYRKHLNPDPEYLYLYAAPEGKMKKEDFENITVLAWELHRGSENHYMVIDYEKASVYYSMRDIITCCGEEYKVADLAAEDILFVEKTLEDSGIVLWENGYEGTSVNTTGNFSWSVAFELKDERCIVYGGRGVINSGTPAEMQVMLAEMKNYFVK